MDKRAPEELKYANDWLLVFNDETGHETFAGTQPYFGVAGCALMGADYELVKAQWRELRRLINGSPDAPLHAADFTPTFEHLAALSAFFRQRAFARIAVTATAATKLEVGMHTMEPVFGMLKQQVARVASLTPCAMVALIFESSDRGDPLVMQYFGTLELEEDGRPVPTEHCIMPKRAAEPGLEIADFIVNAAGSQARRQLRGTEGFAKDYQAVFHQLPSPYGQFCFITDVGSVGQRVSVQALHLKS